ncbi:MAG: hypothetical protein QXH91_06745, partial [Candidatus Bathyarchaeia archaeon]
MILTKRDWVGNTISHLFRQCFESMSSQVKSAPDDLQIASDRIRKNPFLLLCQRMEQTTMGKIKKTPRFGKKPDSVGNIRLQERDIEIIKLVYDYRFLDSKQIQALV